MQTGEGRVGRHSCSGGGGGGGSVPDEQCTHASLHGARLFSIPGLLSFPPECSKADSQPGSSSVYAKTTHKLVQKWLPHWLKVGEERCLEFTGTGICVCPLLPGFIKGVRIFLNKTVK